MLGLPEGEHRRFRLGIIFLVIGLLLILWAWGSWVFRVSADVHPAPAVGLPFQHGSMIGAGGSAGHVMSVAFGLFQSNGPDAPGGGTSGGWRLMSLSLLTILLLLIVFFFGSLAVVIGTRRWRTLAAHKRPPPTPNADAWAMHKLPEDLLD